MNCKKCSVQSKGLFLDSNIEQTFYHSYHLFLLKNNVWASHHWPHFTLESISPGFPVSSVPIYHKWPRRDHFAYFLVPTKVSVRPLTRERSFICLFGISKQTQKAESWCPPSFSVLRATTGNAYSYASQCWVHFWAFITGLSVFTPFWFWAKNGWRREQIISEKR